MQLQATDSPCSTNRRSFIAIAIYGIAALIAAGLGIPGVLYVLSPPNRRRHAEWTDMGDLSNLEPDRPQEVAFRRKRVDGWKITNETEAAWVIKRPGGDITAFSPWCTHLGCAYHWDQKQHEFLCPCHGSRFSADGAVLGGPAPRPLDRYEVRVQGSRVWLGPIEQREETRS